MGGLAVLLLEGLYLFVGYKIVTGAQTKRKKWLAIVILTLIPTADAIVGRVYLQYLCATEGGLKVHRVVNDVKGFMSDGREDVTAVEKYGYKFSESRPLNGRVDRYSKDNGQVVKEKGVLPKSNHRVRLLNEGQVKDIYMRQTLVVETFPGGEVLATDAQIGFNGGWAERFLAAFSDGGINPVWCKGKDVNVRYREIIESSLKP